MTERVHSITITLDKDIRIDDAESLLSACRAFRGVVSVTPNVADMVSCVAEDRARHDLTTRILAALRSPTT